MSIYIGKLEFEGCFSGLDQIENDPGLYAVLAREGEDYQIVEMGECTGVHDYLVERLGGDLARTLEGLPFEMAVYYTDDLPADSRRELLDEIMGEFNDVDENLVVPGGNVLAFSR